MPIPGERRADLVTVDPVDVAIVAHITGRGGRSFWETTRPRLLAAISVASGTMLLQHLARLVSDKQLVWRTAPTSSGGYPQKLSAVYTRRASRPPP